MLAFRNIIIVCLTVFFASCASTSAQRTKSVSLNENSKEAIMLWKVVGPTKHLDLGFVQVDPATQQPIGNMISGTIHFTALEGSASSYVFKKVPAGQHYIGGFRQQRKWWLAFSDNTYKYDILPGTVNFLGTFNTSSHVVQLQQKALASGRLSTSGPTHFFRDNISPPAMVKATTEDVKNAQNFINSELLKISAPLVPVTGMPWKYVPAKK